MKLGKLAAVIVLVLATHADPATVARDAPPPAGVLPRTDLSESRVQRAVFFEPNVGQFQPGVRYRAHAAGMSLSLTDAAAVLWLGREPGSARQIRITPVSASRRARPRALDRLPGVVNHFESATPSAWHAGVPTYGRVRYASVYPGIDLEYHGSPEQLEYDFLVGRGADPAQIAVRFDGADRVEIDPAGDLLIHAGNTVVRQRAPVAWQDHGRERRHVDARYRLTKSGDVAFTIGSYDRRLPLVIDPILLYSSYLHTQTSRVAVDSAGYVVIATEGFLDDPYVPTGLKLERLSPDGQTAIYTTLIGTDYFAIAGVAATSEGEAILAGYTYTADLPLVNASQSYPGDTERSNAFVIKLTPGGGFVFSTYLGGTDSDYAYGVSVNQAGTIAVAGRTGSHDFPGVDGLQSGPTEGFVTLFSPAGSRLHGALLPTHITAVAIDTPGMVYVTSSTILTNWPTTPASFQPTPYQAPCGDYVAPCSQGVLAKLSADLGSLVYSTYLHATEAQVREVNIEVKALAVDAAGAAYILGTSDNGAFAATPGALQTRCFSSSCAFLAKLNPAGSGRVYSTFLPGFPNALQVDSRGNAYLSGTAYLSTTGLTSTPNAQQPRAADAQLFVTTDGGTTWRPTPPRFEANMGVALVHTTGPLLYTGYKSGDAQGLFRSADLGAHWQQIDSQVLGRITIAPSNPNVMYEPLGRLVRRSSDGGATWALVPTPTDVMAFVVDPVDAQTLYLGGMGGLFKSVNGGYAWSPASNGIPAPMSVGTIVAAPSNHNLLLAENWSGWYRSVDGGANWTRIVLPAGSAILVRVTFDPLDATRVYALAAAGATNLVRSTDGGVTWTPFVVDCWCTPLAVTHTPDPTVFVASYDGGLARVIDTGGTVSTPLPVSLANGGVYQLAVDPVDPRIMVAVTNSVSDGFVSVVDPTGAQVRYASYFGGANLDSVDAIALGSGGTLAITGRTWSRDVPLANPRTQRSATLIDSFVALMRIPLPTVVLDVPAAGRIAAPFSVSGWAVDTGAPAGAGIDAIHVWAFPQNGGPPSFVGVGSYGTARPDVGAVLGAQFTNSGFSLTGGSLPAGPYTIAAFARSTVSGTFEAAARSVDVLPGGRLTLDAPTAGATLYQPFTVVGWTFDAAAPSGTGVDAVHVWAYPDAGAPRFVGAASAFVDRPDVGAAFGSRFAPTGFRIEGRGLPVGNYTLVVYARSTVSGTFDLVRTVRVTLPEGGAAAIDTPPAGGTVSTPFEIAGWAVDRQGAGTGVDAIHVWAFPVAGGSPTFIGAATGVSRPDVAAALGDPRFTPSGYSVMANTLPRGQYTLVVYARSTVTGGFSILRLVQVIVN